MSSNDAWNGRKTQISEEKKVGPFQAMIVDDDE